MNQIISQRLLMLQNQNQFNAITVIFENHIDVVLIQMQIFDNFAVKNRIVNQKIENEIEKSKMYNPYARDELRQNVYLKNEWKNSTQVQTSKMT